MTPPFISAGFCLIKSGLLVVTVSSVGLLDLSLSCLILVVHITNRKLIFVASDSAWISTGQQMLSGMQANVRDNRLKLQSVILYEKKECYHKKSMETHLWTQTENASKTMQKRRLCTLL